jgi:hypothetical protein
MLKVLAAAEKVARYRHAQLSAMRLSGDLNARPENVNLDELLASIRADWAVIGPLIDMDPAAPQGSRTEGGLSAGSRRIERDQRSGA